MIYLKTGNIPLNFAFDDEIVQEANSTYQLTFKFPVSDDLFKELKEEVLLLADDLHGEQEFVIFEIVNNHGYCTVYANQVASLLNSYSISELSVDRVTGTRVMTVLAGSIVRDNDFSLSSDIEDEHTLNLKNTSVMNALAKDKHSIIGQWGGDLVRDKYDIQLLKNGGSENESLFMYKKNMKSYTQNKSIKELRTRIHFHKKLESKEGSPEESISVTVDSPLINKYQNVYEYDLEVNDQDVTDLNTLTEYGKKYFRETLCDVVEESIEIDVVGVTDIDVRIFDVVSIFHEKFNIDIRKKVSKYLYSPMGKKLKSIGFGKVQQGLASTISGIVNDEVSNQTRYISSDIDARVKRELKNADLAFDRKAEKLKESINDGIEEYKAKAEELKATIREEIERDKEELLGRVRETTADFNRRLELEKKKTNDSFLGLIETINEVNDEAKRSIEEAKIQASDAVDGLRVSTENTLNSIRSNVSNLDRKFDSNGELISLKHYKSQVEQKDREITTKITALEQYKNADGARQTTLLSLAERKTNELLNREISRLSDTYVAKSTLTETIRGSERKILESIKGFGRNYFLNTKNFSGEWYHGSSWFNEELDDNFTVKSRTGAWAGVSQSIQSDAEEWWTYSVDVKGEGTNGVMIYALHGANSANVNVNQQYISITNVWQRFSFTFKTTSAGIIRPRVEKTNNTGKVYIKKIKLEKGTIPTPWSPAPEDSEIFFTERLATYRQEVDRSISELRGIATDGQSKASRLEQTVNGVSTTVTSLSGRLDNLKVGGRNYIRNYNLRTQSFYPVNSTWTFHREVDPTAKSGYKLKAVCTGVTRSGGFHSPLFDLRPAEFLGREMTWSMDIRTNRDIDLGNLGFEKGGLINPYRSTNTWSRAVKTFTVNQSGYYSVAWYSNHWRVGDWIEIRDPQLEDGSVATTPSAAPEDIDDQVFKKSEFRQTDDKIILAAGYEISNRKLASMISLTPEGIQAITDKMIITPYNENLIHTTRRSNITVTGRHNPASVIGYTTPISNGDEFLVKITYRDNSSTTKQIVFEYEYTDNTKSWQHIHLKPNLQNTNGKYTGEFSFKVTGMHNKTLRKWYIQYHIDAFNNHGSFTVENCEVYQKKSASLIVDGSITSDQIKALAIQAGHLAAGAVTSEKILSGAVEAKHLKVDAALIEKLVAEEALITKLLAKQAFINRLNAITINASQITGGLISGDMISGGVIRGTTIEGVTIQGNSKIKIGQHGFLKPAGTGLHICSPATDNARYGVGMQILGNTGRSGDSPYGFYFYKDPDFYSTRTEDTDNYIMTVQGYIKTKGIGNLKWTNYNDGSTGLKLWSGNRPELLFDTDGNDIKYAWNGTTYGLWGLITSHYNTSSDIRVKRNIRDSRLEALTLVEKLSFKEFDYIEHDIFKGRHVKNGLIAQDIQKLDESLVHYKGDILSIDSFKMLNIALKAIQELSQENKSMKEEIKLLKEKAAYGIKITK